MTRLRLRYYLPVVSDARWRAMNGEVTELDTREEAISGDAKRDYPLLLTLLLVLLWLLGFGVLALFAAFTLFTLGMSGGLLTLWNLLVVLTQGYVLWRAVSMYAAKNRPPSELFLWAVLAAVGVPLVASGGCALMGEALRIAG